MISKIGRFFKSKKDKSDLIIAESYESVNRASAVLQVFTAEA